MSLKGGYQIIDLKFKPFDSREGTSHTFPELFNDLKNSNAKMIIISGLNMDGVKYNDYDVVFYEVEENNEPMYYQAVLRRIWTPIDYTCTTKYISIYNNDKVKITQDTFIYEILPDNKMSSTSTNALQNRVIDQEFTKDRKRLTSMETLQNSYLKLDGSRPMHNTLDMLNNKIIRVGAPTDSLDVANKKYVDDTISQEIEMRKYDNVYSSSNTMQPDYRINIVMPMNISNMSIEIVPSGGTFTLNNTANFSYVGLENTINRFFRSNTAGIRYEKICGSFRFPSNLNIFGTIESSGDIITIKFDGDLTNIDGSNTSILCTAPIVPVPVTI